MAALTANKDTEIREPKTMDHPVAAATKIYAGALVCVNAAGNAIPAADAVGAKFVGVSRDFYDNTAGAAGAIRAVVHRDYIVKIATAATFAVGDLACVLDDQTVTTAAIATNDVIVGTVVRVDVGFVYVDMRIK